MLSRRTLLASAAALAMTPRVVRADDLIADIQQALDTLGYDAGTADGVEGSRTTRAIKTFQREFGYAQDGVANRALLDRLDAAIAAGGASPERMLARSGQLRSYTRAVQESLIARGFDPGPVDGAIGPATRDAIRAYQRANGLPENGEVSRALLSHLLGLDGA